MPYPSPMPEYQPLFHQVQNFIADQLNSDPQLSGIGIEFLPESQLDIEYGIKRNLGRQGMVGIVNTLKGQYGGHDQDSCAWEIESEIDVLETPAVRRAWLKQNNLSAGTTVDVLNYIQESLCGPASPTYGKFCPVTQEIGEDNGVVVGKAVVKTFAIADVSACVSGESNWHIRYATEADISALWSAVEELSAEISGGSWRDAIDQLSADVSTLTDRVDSAEEQIETLDDLAVKYTDDDKYLVVLNPRPNWTTSLRVNDGSAIGNSQIQFGSGQGSYRNYITRNGMVLGLPEDNETPEDVGDTHVQLGGVHNNADLILGSGIHIISSTQTGKSQILMDEQRLYVVTPEEVSAGQTLKAVQVYDDPPLNAMATRDLKKREEPRWHWEYHSANLPDKTSDLTNDSGYVTSSEVSAEISAIVQDLEPRLSAIEGDVSALSAQTLETFIQIGNDISALSAWDTTQDSLISELSTQTISNSTDISALSVEIQEVSANMSKSIIRRWEPVAGLKFVAEEANSTIAMQKSGSAPDVSLEYNTGDGWNDFIVGQTTVTLANVGDECFIRAKTTNTGMGSSASDYNKFVMTGKIAASDSIMYLLKKDGDLSAIPSSQCFNELFVGCSSLTTAPTLPATTLASYCYQNLFNNCTSLTQAPELPATTLASSCYRSMFQNCTSLTTSPELPATATTDSCYRLMFNGCSSLVNPPSELPALSVTYASYADMFAGTAINKSPYIRATSVDGYWAMASMFKDCSSLNEIKMDYTGDFSGTGALTNAFNTWVQGVSADGTFYYDGSDTTRGNSAIPTGWTVEPLTPTVNYVDYINTNRADFDTGYTPTESTVLKGRFRGDTVGLYYVGGRATDNDSCRWEVLDQPTWVGFCMPESSWFGRLTASPWDQSKWWEIEMGNYYGNAVCEDGRTASASKSPVTFAPEASTITLKMGSSTYHWEEYWVEFDCAGFKLYEGETLVKDYRPAIDPNGVVCLYEELSGVYEYPTNGTWTAHMYNE